MTELDELTETERFKLLVCRGGCQIHADTMNCDGPVQAAHIISKQALKRHGHADKLWDVRNGIAACYRAHRRSDAALARFPATLFSSEFWEFADEVNLRWLVEKQYGRQQ